MSNTNKNILRCQNLKFFWILKLSISNCRATDGRRSTWVWILHCMCAAQGGKLKSKCKCVLAAQVGMYGLRPSSAPAGRVCRLQGARVVVPSSGPGVDRARAYELQSRLPPMPVRAGVRQWHRTPQEHRPPRERAAGHPIRISSHMQTRSPRAPQPHCHWGWSLRACRNE